MIEAVDQKKTNLRFYKVDYNLHISSTDWVDQIQTGDIVVLIDYFGFPLSSTVTGLLREQGGYVLEDACQALLSERVGQYSDFVLFSPIKTIGVPDGGILASCCNVRFDDVELGPAPSAWWLKMLEAAINRREFDQYGGDRRWYRLFQEQIYPPVHWLSDGVVSMEFSESYRLAGQVLTLPCDQRYGSEDIHRMVIAVLKTLDNEHDNL